MTAKELTRFKRELQTRRQDLARRVEMGRSRLFIEQGGDHLEHIHRLVECDVAARNLDLDARMLAKVEGALREIEQGTFGRCACCDREIPAKRLAAVPWAPYCVGCQEALERGELEYRPAA